MSNRPKSINQTELSLLVKKMKDKVEKKGLVYSENNIDLYTETRGLTTDAKKLKKLLENQNAVDVLPESAKKYAELLWLEKYHKLYDTSLGNMSQLKQGNLQEENAIKILNLATGNDYKKNRIAVKDKKHFLATKGCDIFSKKESLIRDIKIPKNFISFKNKEAIINIDYWQIIAYCHLFKCKKAVIDYVLMPMHPSLIDNHIRYFSRIDRKKFFATQQAIENMPVKSRIKTIKLETGLATEIAFLKRRCIMTKEYYDELDTNKALNIKQHGTIIKKR